MDFWEVTKMTFRELLGLLFKFVKDMFWFLYGCFGFILSVITLAIGGSLLWIVSIVPFGLFGVLAYFYSGNYKKLKMERAKVLERI